MLLLLLASNPPKRLPGLAVVALAAARRGGKECSVFPSGIEPLRLLSGGGKLNDVLIGLDAPDLRPEEEDEADAANDEDVPDKRLICGGSRS